MLCITYNTNFMPQIVVEEKEHGEKKCFICHEPTQKRNAYGYIGTRVELLLKK